MGIITHFNLSNSKIASHARNLSINQSIYLSSIACTQSIYQSIYLSIYLQYLDLKLKTSNYFLKTTLKFVSTNFFLIKFILCFYWSHLY